MVNEKNLVSSFFEEDKAKENRKLEKNLVKRTIVIVLYLIFGEVSQFNSISIPKFSKEKRKICTFES